MLETLPAQNAVTRESQWDQLTLEVFPSWEGTSAVAAIERAFVDTKEQVRVCKCVSE